MAAQELEAARERERAEIRERPSSHPARAGQTMSGRYAEFTSWLPWPCCADRHEVGREHERDRAEQRALGTRAHSRASWYMKYAPRVVIPAAT